MSSLEEDSRSLPAGILHRAEAARDPIGDRISSSRVEIALPVTLGCRGRVCLSKTTSAKFEASV